MREHQYSKHGWFYTINGIDYMPCKTMADGRKKILETSKDGGEVVYGRIKYISMASVFEEYFNSILLMLEHEANERDWNYDLSQTFFQMSEKEKESLKASLSSAIHEWQMNCNKIYPAWEIHDVKTRTQVPIQ